MYSQDFIKNFVKFLTDLSVPIEVVYMDIAGESVPVHIMDCIADDPSEDADQIEIRPRSPGEVT